VRYEDTIEVRGVALMRETDVALLGRMGSQDRGGEHRGVVPERALHRRVRGSRQ
jgi:hypothetical protein